MVLIETAIGLPNTCTICGRNPGETWYMETEDKARSGIAFCREHALERDPSLAEPEDGLRVNTAAELWEQTSEGAPIATIELKPPDDLMEIHGIGVATNGKLNHMGIHTFQELLEANPLTVARHIGKSPNQVEDWQKEVAGEA